MAAKSFVFVTGNANKLKEVQAILATGSSITLTSENLKDLPEIQGTTVEVAKAKCKAAAIQVGGPCITEDTSLGFTALNGLPGPYIKDFMQGIGHEGLNNMLVGFSTKEATAKCTFAFCSSPDAEPIVFEGETKGQIVPARGSTHFGWDAVFQPDEGEGKTYAEMDGAAKNLISHRYRALVKLRDYLASL